MQIKLVDEFSTDIEDILTLANKKNSFFISNWDKDEHILNIDAEIIESSVQQQEHKNTYIMSKDMHTLKKEIVAYLRKINSTVSEDQLTIVSNGTCAAFISLLQLFKRNLSNYLFIGPIYFTYMQLLKIFCKKAFYYNVDLFKKIEIDIDSLGEEVVLNNIHCIVLIQPFFGSGIELSPSTIKELLLFCEKQKIFLILDYVYGNMKWGVLSHIHNPELIELILSSEYSIIFESISKRIFLNGMKNAVIFGSRQFIANINIDSEICLGSISFVQESLLQNLYSPSNLSNIDAFISDAITYASNNYSLLYTMFLDTDIMLCNSNNGYFTLIAIPKRYFNAKEDRYIVKEIYHKTGIVTIPHSRYYYNLSGYFCFRVNLTLQTSDLMSAAKKLLQICSN